MNPKHAYQKSVYEANSFNPKHMNLQNLSDQELYKFCQSAGRNSRKWMREFAYALPEVDRRELYRKYKFSTIYEFASKIGGMQFEVCKRVLHLAWRFRSVPRAWEQIRSQGWTKLQTISGVINEDNQEVWIKNLNLCTKAGLRELVNSFKKEHLVPKENSEGGNSSLNKAKIGQSQIFGNEVPSQKTALDGSGHSINSPKMEIIKFKVDDDTKFQFKKFKINLEKKKGALTMGEALKLLLEKANQNSISKNSPKSSRQRKSPNRLCEKDYAKQNKKPASRYIPVFKKREVEKQQNGRCCSPDCNEPIQQFHHPDRFSLKKSHKNLVGICNSHHQLAHLGFINELSNNWKVRWQRQAREAAIEKVDAVYSSFLNSHPQYPKSKKSYLHNQFYKM